ncbi:replication factor c subunit 5 protein [Rutstroemia sp. NJR-2017a WRK4]|nr:replication factor c subunit 5 protein [Rutstroemia sp. NJR-2017a WRK4]
MTEATNTKLMDTERGGENTQYESIHTYIEPHAKDSGTFKDPNPNEAEQKAAAEKRERGEKTAENIRYGEAISEHGMGGETVGNSRGVNPPGGEESVEEKGDKARHAQGYGPGSGVGA